MILGLSMVRFDSVPVLYFECLPNCLQLDVCPLRSCLSLTIDQNPVLSL